MVIIDYRWEGHFFFQAEDGIRGHCVTGVQTCALPIFALALLLGRPIADDEYPGEIGSLVNGSFGLGGGFEPFPEWLREWLSQALSLEPTRWFASAVEARHAFEIGLKAGGHDASRERLEAFLREYSRFDQIEPARTTPEPSRPKPASAEATARKPEPVRPAPETPRPVAVAPKREPVATPAPVPPRPVAVAPKPEPVQAPPPVPQPESPIELVAMGASLKVDAPKPAPA